jgi:hypothetical protein
LANDLGYEVIYEIRDYINTISNAALRGMDSRHPDFVLPDLSDDDMKVLDSAANIFSRISEEIDNRES